MRYHFHLLTSIVITDSRNTFISFDVGDIFELGKKLNVVTGTVIKTENDL